MTQLPDDVRATIAAALEVARDAAEREFIYGDEDKVKRIDRARAWLTQQAAQQQPRVQPYSHRNGESEPPTEVGWYWFKGIAVGERYEGSVTVEKAIAGNLCVEGPNESTFEEIRRWGEGQWYGPITPPWSQPATAQESSEVDDG